MDKMEDETSDDVFNEPVMHQIGRCFYFHQTITQSKTNIAINGVLSYPNGHKV